ncbi:MAG: substrate-binding domain-containing protein, partial [Firmicutes bacterium]|nr:substrate-binding domain-containing protein [Bacillota bacterium]
ISGATDAGNELDCNVYIGGCLVEGDWKTQDKLIEQALNERKADAFVIAPASSSAQLDTIGDIYKSGKPVILVDTIINSEDYNTCYMTDNLQAGELAAKEMLSRLISSGLSEDESASIAIQIGSTSSQTIIDRLAGFNQYWAVNAPENWTVLDEVKLNNGNKDKAKQNGVDFLSDYPDLKGFFGCNNSSTVGFVSALKERAARILPLWALTMPTKRPLWSPRTLTGRPLSYKTSTIWAMRALPRLSRF